MAQKVSEYEQEIPQSHTADQRHREEEPQLKNTFLSINKWKTKKRK